MPIAELNKQSLLDYCKDQSDVRSSLLLELEEHTWKNEDVPQMISGSIVGTFLQSIIHMTSARHIIEVGMFTGYSALTMAEALPDNGEVHTCELMQKHIDTANSFFQRSKHGNKIHIHAGSAVSSLEQLPSESFDMAFIDADKSNYLRYYQRCMVLIREGGVIVLDNMLWGGNVLDPQDDDSKALRNTADFIQQDKRVYNTLLPIRDGLMVCIKS